MKGVPLFLLLTLVCSAEVRLPAIFSDNLVLQQRSGNPIWGWAAPKEKVTLKTSGLFSGLATYQEE